MTLLTGPVSPASDAGLLPAAGRSALRSQRRYLQEASPWRAVDLGRGTALFLLGAAVSTGSWYVASGKEQWRDQISWLLGGLLGAGLAALSGFLFLAVGFREVRRGMREIELDMRTVLQLPPAARSGPEPALHRVAVEDSVLVCSKGMRRSHRPDCLLMRGKPAQAAPAGLPRCGACP